MLICISRELVAGAGNSENCDSFFFRCFYYAVTRAARGVRSARLGQKYSKSILENVVLEFPVSDKLTRSFLSKSNSTQQTNSCWIQFVE